MNFSKYISPRDSSEFSCVNVSELNSDSSFVRNSKRSQLKMRFRMLPRSLKRHVREALHLPKRRTSFSLEDYFPSVEDTIASTTPTTSTFSTDTTMTITSIFNLERDTHQPQLNNKAESTVDTCNSGCSNCRLNHIELSVPAVHSFKDDKCDKPNHSSGVGLDAYPLPENVPRYEFDFNHVFDRCLKEIQDVMKHFNDSSHEVSSEPGASEILNRVAIPYGSYHIDGRLQRKERDTILVSDSDSKFRAEATNPRNSYVAYVLNVNHAFDHLFNEFKELTEVVGKYICESVSETVVQSDTQFETKPTSQEEATYPVYDSVGSIVCQFELTNTDGDNSTSTIASTTADTFSIPTNFFKEEVNDSTIPTDPVPWKVDVLPTKTMQKQTQSQFGQESDAQSTSNPISTKENTETTPEMKSTTVKNNILSWMPRAKLHWRQQTQASTHASQNYKEEFKKLEALIKEQHELLYDEKLDTATRKLIQKKILEYVERKEELQQKLNSL
ncbi:hypothetical protein G9P44_000864 [Scheffersomyces stipitis]|nr:hypothetical protein G9P44_000864 [Scheffersomyces stipitis]